MCNNSSDDDDNCIDRALTTATTTKLKYEKKGKKTNNYCNKQNLALEMNECF